MDPAVPAQKEENGGGGGGGAAPEDPRVGDAGLRDVSLTVSRSALRRSASRLQAVPRRRRAEAAPGGPERLGRSLPAGARHEERAPGETGIPQGLRPSGGVETQTFTRHREESPVEEAQAGEEGRTGRGPVCRKGSSH